jgi:fatty acid desaturase
MDQSFSAAIPKSALRPLTRRSDWRGGLHLIGHLCLIACTAWLAYLARGSGWLFPAMALHGIAMIFLFAPLHECIHRTAFRSRWIDDAVAWACGAILALPPTYFRAFHFAHHRFTQDPTKDPELATPKPTSLPGYLFHVSGLPYWRAQAGVLIRHALGRVDDGFIAPSQRGAAIAEARAYILLYVGFAGISALTQNSLLVTFWLVPVLLGQPALRLYLLAEHTGCPEIPDMLANSRTTLTLWPLRALAWNMPHHAEHHAYPGLPFHALPAAHRLMRSKIAVLGPGYIAVHREILGKIMRAPSSAARRGQT